jgi:integrase
MTKKAAQPIKSRDQIFDMQDYLKERSERDYILFLLGISTGYRAGDLVKLKVRDIRKAIKNDELEILESKKEKWAISKNVAVEKLKPRKADITDKLAKKLIEYTKNKKDYEYLFPSRKGINTHIAVSSFGKILREAGQALGMKHIGTHTLRKTYAYTNYVNSNYDILKVQKLLQHSHPSITELYLGLEANEFKEYSKLLDKNIR